MKNIRGTKKRAARLVAGSLLALIVAAIIPGSTSAAGGNGLRISPVRTDLTIPAGASKTVNVNVTNVTAVPATLQTIINDFTASADETGNPAIILDPSQYAASHSLKRFVAKTGNITLAPGQAKTVPIVINVPKTAVGGGYYGAVRFAPAGSTGANNNVTLASSVGSLVLVTVPGNITEKLTIASFDVRHNNSPSSFFTSSKNLTATVRFQNQGNIQDAPFGKILLRNRSGKILATYEVNNVSPPGNVLPDSIRKFPTSLTKVTGFGQYKLEGNFGYGSSGQLLSASTTFYVVPVAVIVIFVAIVALLVFLIFVLPRMIRAYNRRVLRKAGRVMGKAGRR